MKGWQVVCALVLLPVAVTEMYGSADQTDLRPWQALQDQCFEMRKVQGLMMQGCKVTNL